MKNEEVADTLGWVHSMMRIFIGVSFSLNIYEAISKDCPKAFSELIGISSDLMAFLLALVTCIYFGIFSYYSAKWLQLIIYYDYDISKTANFVRCAGKFCLQVVLPSGTFLFPISIVSKISIFFPTFCLMLLLTWMVTIELATLYLKPSTSATGDS